MSLYHFSFRECSKAANLYDSCLAWYQEDNFSYSAAALYGWLKLCFNNSPELPLTPDGCIADALSYFTPEQWAEASSSKFEFAKQNGYLEACVSHMPWHLARIEKLTLADCIKDAKRCHSENEWQIDCPSTYRAAEYRGWLSLCLDHQNGQNGQNTDIQLEDCQRTAKYYDSRDAWKTAHPQHYEFAKSKRWIKLCTSHMNDEITWALASCMRNAKKYTTKTEWRKQSSRAFRAAEENGWLDYCCEHMPADRVRWTPEALKNNAEQYDSYKDWKQQQSYAFKVARDTESLAEITAHMNDVIIEDFFTTADHCIDDALKYDSEDDWKENAPKIYRLALRKHWLDAIRSVWQNNNQ